MSKEQWIDEVYALLCKAQGEPENETEVANMRGWAEALSGEESGYFQEGMTPQDAVDEEMSNA